jgi:hypothetical protein
MKALLHTQLWSRVLVLIERPISVFLVTPGRLGEKVIHRISIRAVRLVHISTVQRADISDSAIFED